MWVCPNAIEQRGADSRISSAAPAKRREPSVPAICALRKHAADRTRIIRANSPSWFSAPLRTARRGPAPRHSHSARNWLATSDLPDRPKHVSRSERVGTCSSTRSGSRPCAPTGEDQHERAGAYECSRLAGVALADRAERPPVVAGAGYHPGTVGIGDRVVRTADVAGHRGARFLIGETKDELAADIGLDRPGRGRRPEPDLPPPLLVGDDADTQLERAVKPGRQA